MEKSSSHIQMSLGNVVTVKFNIDTVYLRLYVYICQKRRGKKKH